MAEFIAPAIEGLAFPASEQGGEAVVDLDLEVAAGMARVRNAALRKDGAKGHLAVEDEFACLVVEVVQMNSDRAELHGSEVGLPLQHFDYTVGVPPVQVNERACDLGAIARKSTYRTLTRLGPD